MNMIQPAAGHRLIAAGWERPAGESTIEAALDLLTLAGFDFAVVERCPGLCPYCDDPLYAAA